MYKKSPKTLEIITQWMDFFTNHFDLVDDTPSKLPNLSTFVEYRHDQSVLSALMYLNDCVNFDGSFYKEGSGGFAFLYNRNEQFLFSDKNNVIIECENGYLKFVYINVYSKFLELYSKKANFLKKCFRIYYKFPRWIIKNYKSLLKN